MNIINVIVNYVCLKNCDDFTPTEIWKTSGHNKLDLYFGQYYWCVKFARWKNHDAAGKSNQRKKIKISHARLDEISYSNSFTLEKFKAPQLPMIYSPYIQLYKHFLPKLFPRGKRQLQRPPTKLSECRDISCLTDLSFKTLSTHGQQL